MKDAVTATTDYYYQGGAVLQTTDGNGKQTSLNLIGVENNVIATARGTGDSADWYLYNKDVREGASSLVDGDGKLAAAYLYDPFGNTETLANENFENEIRYTGQIYDKSTGLYYYNARYYDPEDGRFLSQDTYRGENMEPETLHLYGYCANNPLNYVDPSGHWVQKMYKVINEKQTFKSKAYKGASIKITAEWWRSTRLGKVLMYKNPSIKSYKRKADNAGLIKNVLIPKKNAYHEVIQIRTALAVSRYSFTPVDFVGALSNELTRKIDFILVFEVKLWGGAQHKKSVAKTKSYLYKVNVKRFKRYKWGNF